MTRERFIPSSRSDGFSDLLCLAYDGISDSS